MAKELRDSLDLEVEIMTSRMNQIETKLATKSLQSRFGLSVSLVISGLSHEEDKDLLSKGSAEIRSELRSGANPGSGGVYPRVRH